MFWKDMLMHTNTSEIADERRLKFRFPLQRELRYKLVKDGAVLQSGLGETINIGSGGVSFTADRDVAVGSFVQLSISWPVLLDRSCPMRLIVFGRILRSSMGSCACSLDKYEFRTQSRAPQQITPRNDVTLERWVENVRKEQSKGGMATA
jgi:hypothetical protein